MTYRDKERVRELYIDGFSLTELSIMYGVTPLRIYLTVNKIVKLKKELT